MQNAEHVLKVSTLAAKYMTPGGPDNFDPNQPQEDKKSQVNDNNNKSKTILLGPPPSLDRQITQYCFIKYTPTQLKELVETVFSEHFDKEHNDDIDFKEFKNALQNLGLNMTQNRIQKLFKLINTTDGSSKDQYIDKTNFSDFLLQKYYNKPKLQAYQEELLRIISPKFNDTNIPGLDKTVTDNTILSENEELEMKRQLGLLINDELQHHHADASFQEELLKRKTKNNNKNRPKFCDESNAEQWDRYEVAYWVGNILGFAYCMKRFFDEKIEGNMLLFDVDSKMLLNNLSLRQIHLNNFQRRLENLRKVALKDMYEQQRKNKQKQRQLAEKQRRDSLILVLDYTTMNNIHIDSDTRYLDEEKKTEIQRIELQATKHESKLTHEISELNKKIARLTSDKLELIQRVNNMKQESDHKVLLLQNEMQQMKVQSGGKYKEKQSLKREIALLNQKNKTLQIENEELQARLMSGNGNLNSNIGDDGVDKSDNIYKIEIEKLKSQLRTKDMKNALLQRQLTSLRKEIIENYDGEQKSAELNVQPTDDMVHVMEPPSPPPKQNIIAQKSQTHRAVKPNKFLSMHQQEKDETEQYRQNKKKGSMDDDHHFDEETDGMIIYDSDNTPQ